MLRLIFMLVYVVLALPTLVVLVLVFLLAEYHLLDDFLSELLHSDMKLLYSVSGPFS